MRKKMSKTIEHSFNFIENDYLPKRIRVTSNELIVKKEKEKGKSVQEFYALQTARILLPKILKLPESWGVVDDSLVSKYYKCSKINLKSKDDAFRAVDYLIKLHNIEISERLKKELTKNGYCHYYGKNLKFRLKYEYRKSLLAFGKFSELSLFLVKLKEIVDYLCNTTNKEEPVLGHGDFQACNILIWDNKVIPIDWTDFGLCDRAYEAHHYVYSLKKDFRDEIYEYYLNKTNWDRKKLDIGIGIDAVIRAGNRARHILADNAGNIEKSIDKFREQVERGAKAIDR